MVANCSNLSKAEVEQTPVAAARRVEKVGGKVLPLPQDFPHLVEGLFCFALQWPETISSECGAFVVGRHKVGRDPILKERRIFVVIENTPYPIHDKAYKVTLPDSQGSAIPFRVGLGRQIAQSDEVGGIGVSTNHLILFAGGAEGDSDGLKGGHSISVAGNRVRNGPDHGRAAIAARPGNVARTIVDNSPGFPVSSNVSSWSCPWTSPIG